MKKTSALLIMIHCEQHTGYAVGALEQVFLEAALKAGYEPRQIFWSYSQVKDLQHPGIIQCQFNGGQNYAEFCGFIESNNIRQVLAFDLGYPADILPVLRNAGVERIISYWGAGMSSINFGLKLLIKKLDWHLRRYKPDHFVFESAAMQATATCGRGVPEAVTSVIPLGVDTNKFTPAYNGNFYAHEQLGINHERKIVFYSGHMEERKGVRVIMQAAVYLVQTLGEANVHFVICGNKNNEADVFESMVAGTAAESHVTFAGYRTDIAELMRSSYIGVIASTGWDSFTMSSVEMMASGLPLVVSRLQGLAEVVAENENGYFIEPGDYQDLAGYIKCLLDQPVLAQNFSSASRSRAEQVFGRSCQVNSIAKLLQSSAN